MSTFRHVSLSLLDSSLLLIPLNNRPISRAVSLSNLSDFHLSVSLNCTCETPLECNFKVFTCEEDVVSREMFEPDNYMSTVKLMDRIVLKPHETKDVVVKVAIMCVWNQAPKDYVEVKFLIAMNVYEFLEISQSDGAMVESGVINFPARVCLSCVTGAGYLESVYGDCNVTLELFNESNVLTSIKLQWMETNPFRNMFNFVPILGTWIDIEAQSKVKINCSFSGQAGEYDVKLFLENKFGPDSNIPIHIDLKHPVLSPIEVLHNGKLVDTIQMQCYNLMENGVELELRNLNSNKLDYKLSCNLKSVFFELSGGNEIELVRVPGRGFMNRIEEGEVPGKFVVWFAPEEIESGKFCHVKFKVNISLYNKSRELVYVHSLKFDTKVATSIVTCMTPLIHFGECSLQIRKSIFVSFVNHSDLSSKLSFIYSSKCLFCPSTVVLPPNSTSQVKFSFIPRKISPNYRKQISVINSGYPIPTLIDVKANNLDKHGILYHSTYYSVFSVHKGKIFPCEFLPFRTEVTHPCMQVLLVQNESQSILELNLSVSVTNVSQCPMHLYQNSEFIEESSSKKIGDVLNKDHLLWSALMMEDSTPSSFLDEDSERAWVEKVRNQRREFEICLSSSTLVPLSVLKLNPGRSSLVYIVCCLQEFDSDGALQLINKIDSAAVENTPIYSENSLPNLDKKSFLLSDSLVSNNSLSNLDLVPIFPVAPVLSSSPSYGNVTANSDVTPNSSTAVNGASPIVDNSSNQSRRIFEGFIKFDLNNGESIRLLPYIAKVYRIPFTLGQQNLHFGQLNNFESHTKSLSIVNPNPIPLLFRIRASASGDLTCPHRLGVVQSFGHKEVKFTFKPSLAGMFLETLLIENILDPSCNQILTVKADIVRPENFWLQNLNLDFGSLVLGNPSRSRRITLKNISPKTRIFTIKLGNSESNIIQKVYFALHLSEKGSSIDVEAVEEEIEKLSQKLKIARRKGKVEKVANYEEKIRQLQDKSLKNENMDESIALEGANVVENSIEFSIDAHSIQTVLIWFSPKLPQVSLFDDRGLDLESGILKVFETKNPAITKDINFSAVICTDEYTHAAVSSGMVPKPRQEEALPVIRPINCEKPSVLASYLRSSEIGSIQNFDFNSSEFEVLVHESYLHLKASDMILSNLLSSSENFNAIRISNYSDSHPIFLCSRFVIRSKRDSLFEINFSTLDRLVPTLKSSETVLFSTLNETEEYMSSLNGSIQSLSWKSTCLVYVTVNAPVTILLRWYQPMGFFPSENQRDIRGKVEISRSGMYNLSNKIILPVRCFPNQSPIILIPSVLKLGNIFISSSGEIKLKSFNSGAFVSNNAISCQFFLLNSGKNDLNVHIEPESGDSSKAFKSINATEKILLKSGIKTRIQVSLNIPANCSGETVFSLRIFDDSNSVVFRLPFALNLSKQDSFMLKGINELGNLDLGFCNRFLGNFHNFDKSNILFESALLGLRNVDLNVLQLLNDTNNLIAVSVSSNCNEIATFNLPPSDYPMFATSANSDAIPMRYFLGRADKDFRVNNFVSNISWNELFARYYQQGCQIESIRSYFRSTEQPSKGRIYMIAPQSSLDLYVFAVPSQAHQNFTCGLKFIVETVTLSLDSSLTAHSHIENSFVLNKKPTVSNLQSRLSQLVNFWFAAYHDVDSLAEKIKKYAAEKWGVRLHWRSEITAAKTIKCSAKVYQLDLVFSKIPSLGESSLETKSFGTISCIPCQIENNVLDLGISSFKWNWDQIIYQSSPTLFSHSNMIDFGRLAGTNIQRKLFLIFSNPNNFLPIYFSIKTSSDTVTVKEVPNFNSFAKEFTIAKTSQNFTTFIISAASSILIEIAINICDVVGEFLFEEQLHIFNESDSIATEQGASSFLILLRGRICNDSGISISYYRNNMNLETLALGDVNGLTYSKFSLGFPYFYSTAIVEKQNINEDLEQLDLDSKLFASGYSFPKKFRETEKAYFLLQTKHPSCTEFLIINYKADFISLYLFSDITLVWNYTIEGDKCQHEIPKLSANDSIINVFQEPTVPSVSSNLMLCKSGYSETVLLLKPNSKGKLSIYAFPSIRIESSTLDLFDSTNCASNITGLLQFREVKSDLSLSTIDVYVPISLPKVRTKFKNTGLYKSFSFNSIDLGVSDYLTRWSSFGFVVNVENLSLHLPSYIAIALPKQINFGSVVVAIDGLVKFDIFAAGIFSDHLGQGLTRVVKVPPCSSVDITMILCPFAIDLSGNYKFDLEITNIYDPTYLDSLRVAFTVTDCPVEIIGSLNFRPPQLIEECDFPINSSIVSRANLRRWYKHSRSISFLGRMLLSMELDILQGYEIAKDLILFLKHASLVLNFSLHDTIPEYICAEFSNLGGKIADLIQSLSPVFGYFASMSDSYLTGFSINAVILSSLHPKLQEYPQIKEILGKVFQIVLFIRKVINMNPMPSSTVSLKEFKYSDLLGELLMPHEIIGIDNVGQCECSLNIKNISSVDIDLTLSFKASEIFCNILEVSCYDSGGNNLSRVLVTANSMISLVVRLNICDAFRSVIRSGIFGILKLENSDVNMCILVKGSFTQTGLIECPNKIINKSSYELPISLDYDSSILNFTPNSFVLSPHEVLSVLVQGDTVGDFSGFIRVADRPWLDVSFQVQVEQLLKQEELKSPSRTDVLISGECVKFSNEVYEIYLKPCTTSLIYFCNKSLHEYELEICEFDSACLTFDRLLFRSAPNSETEISVQTFTTGMGCFSLKNNTANTDSLILYFVENAEALTNIDVSALTIRSDYDTSDLSFGSLVVGNLYCSRYITLRNISFNRLFVKLKCLERDLKVINESNFGLSVLDVVLDAGQSKRFYIELKPSLPYENACFNINICYGDLETSFPVIFSAHAPAFSLSKISDFEFKLVNNLESNLTCANGFRLYLITDLNSNSDCTVELEKIEPTFRYAIKDILFIYCLERNLESICLELEGCTDCEVSRIETEKVPRLLLHTFTCQLQSWIYSKTSASSRSFVMDFRYNCDVLIYLSKVVDIYPVCSAMLKVLLTRRELVDFEVLRSIIDFSKMITRLSSIDRMHEVQEIICKLELNLK